jgi:hypothetical protein
VAKMEARLFPMTTLWVRILHLLKIINAKDRSGQHSLIPPKKYETYVRIMILLFLLASINNLFGHLLKIV